MNNVKHYGLTREEFASKAGKHPSCFANRLRAMCGNGNFHAITTRDKTAVDCPVCRDRLNLPKEVNTTLTALDVAKLAASMFIAQVTDDNFEELGHYIREELGARYRYAVNMEEVDDIFDNVSSALLTNGCGAPTESDVCNAVLELKA